MNAAEFLALFPQVKTDYSTGGGCTAWYVDLSNGTDKWLGILITNGEDAQQPEITAKRAAFGFVNDGEGVEPRIMTWAAAANWLRGVTDYHDSLTLWSGK